MITFLLLQRPLHIDHYFFFGKKLICLNQTLNRYAMRVSPAICNRVVDAVRGVLNQFVSDIYKSFIQITAKEVNLESMSFYNKPLIFLQGNQHVSPQFMQ